jgi:hypothetical protein
MRYLILFFCMAILQPALALAQGVKTLTSGASLRCEARSGNKAWPCQLRITMGDSSGNLIGELTWANLNSVHRIRGKLQGDKFTFTEIEAIRSGRAHLNVSYNMTVSDKTASGTYRDAVDRSTGTMTIFLSRVTEPKPAPPTPVAKPEPKPAPPTPAAKPEPTGVRALLSGRSLSCEARSGNKAWPCQLRITMGDSSGNLIGELTWANLNSVHRIRGKLQGDKLTFTETEAIRSGRAHLNVSYNMTVSDKTASGTYRDAIDRSTGTMTITLR